MSTVQIFFFFCFCSSAMLLTGGCQQLGPPKVPELLAHFQELSQHDTLHFEISEETETSSDGDTIPNALFFSVISLALLQEIGYLADSAEAVVLGRRHFSLDDNTEAYWVEIRQYWFQHHCLLVYDKSRKTVTDRVTLAEWYGGEGGQNLIGSWMFDFDGDGHKDIVRREIQHSIIPQEEEVLERTEEAATLLLWKNGKFVETPLPDTAAVINRYPIRTMW